MACNHCVVRELNFQIKAHGELNLRVLPEVIHHLSRRNTIHKVEENVITIKEAEARDLLDFCNDHMESGKIEFRIDDQTWRPLSELPNVLDMEWIDEVITKGLVTCYFQPIVNVREEIFAYELLSRFKKKTDPLSILMRFLRRHGIVGVYML